MTHPNLRGTSLRNEPQRDYIQELRRFSVCQLADALGPHYPVETHIRPINAQFRICGRALTVQSAPGDNLTVHHALHIAEPGEVVIVGGSPSSDGALWGELMSISAQSRGLGGTIIDGPVRDPVEIENLGYPVFCRDFTPRRATKEVYGRIHVTVQLGNISVNPRDIVLADANGILCIEPARAQEAVALAAEIASREDDIKNQIRLGRTTFEILELGQQISQQEAE